MSQDPQPTDPAAPRPTGTLTQAPAGRVLSLRRTLADPPETVWATLTESDRTARWFGSWTGTPGAGNTIQVAMSFEEGSDPVDVRIVACEAPRHLEMTVDNPAGGWHLEVWLTGSDGGTSVELVHHLPEDAPVAEIGPGWEYYLDNFVAAHTGGPAVSFDDYYPAQRDYYAGL
ncbi:SRPBCC family protein [Georgenia sp. SYP-B2076]|uniref:SRPBCC family protein n=1 Tax=Georgenia sp. SYP-B2076 TaxID=2495881 RepID=UPI000F8F5FC0|nr:SRPBCC family protein [Georgenia sp. SYP-B2076]